MNGGAPDLELALVRAAGALGASKDAPHESIRVIDELVRYLLVCRDDCAAAMPGTRCGGCGIEFDRTPFGKGRGRPRVYCDNCCIVEAGRPRRDRLTLHRKALKRPLALLACKVCSHEFTPATPRAVACSDACRLENKRNVARVAVVAYRKRLGELYRRRNRERMVTARAQTQRETAP